MCGCWFLFVLAVVRMRLDGAVWNFSRFVFLFFCLFLGKEGKGEIEDFIDDLGGEVYWNLELGTWIQK